MKRACLLSLYLVLMICLCSCGGERTPEASQPEPTEIVTQTSPSAEPTNYISAIIFGVGGALLGFFIGRVEVFISVKHDAYKQKVLEFYSPVYVTHLQYTSGCARNYTDLSSDAQDDMFNIIIGKMIFADKHLQENITVFLWTHNNYKQGISDESDIAALNENYQRIVSHSEVEHINAMDKLLSPMFLSLISTALDEVFKKWFKKRDPKPGRNEK